MAPFPANVQQEAALITATPMRRPASYAAAGVCAPYGINAASGLAPSLLTARAQ